MTNLRHVDRDRASLSEVSLGKVGLRLRQKDPKTRANRLFREASQQLEKGQLQVALVTFEKVLGIRKKLGDRKGEAEALFQLGKVHERMGNKNWAQQFYQRSREIAVR